MNITILIGNGFDLNLGLHTSYKDFLNYYKKNINSKPNKMLDSIKNDADLWSDFELGIGKASSLYKDDEIEQYNADCQEIINQLNSYLKLENKKAQSLNSSNVYKFIHSFIDIKDKLITIEKNKLSFLKFNPKYDIDFYNFNFTDTLYIALGKTLSGREPTMYSEQSKYEYKLIRMHGTLKENMIVGVDNASQIKNKSFASNVDTTNFLVKNKNMEYFNFKNIESFHKSVNKADLVIIYGMSLGDTDKRYWVEIIDALLANKNAFLLIILKDDRYFSHMPASPTSKKIIKKYIAKFLQHRDGLDESQTDSLKKRIVVSTQYNIFNS